MIASGIISATNASWLNKVPSREIVIFVEPYTFKLLLFTFLNTLDDWCRTGLSLGEILINSLLLIIVHVDPLSTRKLAGTSYRNPLM